MDTAWLDRKLVSLCGNYSIKIDNDSTAFVGTGLAESSLSNVLYKKKKISTDSNFGKDVGNIFNTVQSNLFFIGDDYQIETGYFQTTLVANGNIPSRFVVMNKNGSDDKEEHTIFKSFDLSEKSSVGAYLRRHLSEQTFVDKPIFVDFENKYVTINGIELASGSLTSKKVYLDEISDNAVSDLFRTNAMIPANVLHISFNVSDVDFETGEFYCMYVEEIKLGEFYPSGFKKDFVPLVFDASVSGIIDVSEFSGVIINDDTDIPFLYCKSSGKIISSSNIADNKILLSDKLFVNFVIEREQESKLSTNKLKSFSFKLSTGFDQSQKIRFIFNNMDFELIADALPNNPNFGLEDAERFVFNPSGDIHQQSRSMCKAFANMVGDTSHHTLEYDGEYLVLSSEQPYLNFDVVSMISDVQLVYLENTDISPVLSDNNLYETNGDLFVDEYLKSNSGFHRVSRYLPYNQNGLVKRWVVENEYRGKFDTDRVWRLETIEFGLLNPINQSSLETTIKENKTIVEASIKKYLPQDSLTISEEYVVDAGSIESDGITYNSGDVFVATSETVTFLTTGSKVYISKYFFDDEVQSFLNTNLGDILQESSAEVALSWVILGTKDSKQEDYELEFSQTQNFFEHDYQPSLNTHSFYLLSNEMGGLFDEVEYAIPSKDYFIEYFGDKYSLVSKDKFGYQTVFNGARLRFDSEEMENYRFSCVMNIMSIDSANAENKKLLNFKVLHSEENKTIVLLIELYVSDYKALSPTNEILVDYAYIAMMSAIYKNGGYGDEFTLPTITGVTYTDPSSSYATDTFKGLKINHTINPQANPPINGLEFVGNYMRVDTTVRDVNGDVGGIIGFHRTNMSLVSNLSNLHTGSGGFFEIDPSSSASNPVSVNGNTITFENGMIYAMTLNGTLFDTYLPVSLVKSIETFKDYEWYQVQDIKRGYERIRKMLSLAGVYDIFNTYQDSIENQFGRMVFEKPSDNGFYDAFFTINTIENGEFSGSTVYSNWYTEQNPWVSYLINWYNLPQYSNLSSLLSTEININIE